MTTLVCSAITIRTQLVAIANAFETASPLCSEAGNEGDVSEDIEAVWRPVVANVLVCCNEDLDLGDPSHLHLSNLPSVSV
jgi:hypothetical protein